MILVQFEGYSPISLLYHDVIPFKAVICVVCLKSEKGRLNRNLRNGNELSIKVERRRK